LTGPLEMTFDVACSPGHAFSVWTSGIGTWWPPDHTVSGRPDLVVLEPGVGGRLYERDPDGSEHDWGRVTAWEPPDRLAYDWHIGRGPEEATEVEIRFRDLGERGTRIEIEHRGWERMGADAGERRDSNRRGWDTLLPHYRGALTERTG